MQPFNTATISTIVETEDRGNPRGIVPIWRARSVTEYKPELLPPEPVPLPVKDSLDSLVDIIDYLQQQYGRDDNVEYDAMPPVPSPEMLIDSPTRQ